MGGSTHVNAPKKIGNLNHESMGISLPEKLMSFWEWKDRFRSHAWKKLVVVQWDTSLLHNRREKDMYVSDFPCSIWSFAHPFPNYLEYPQQDVPFARCIIHHPWKSMKILDVLPLSSIYPSKSESSFHSSMKIPEFSIEFPPCFPTNLPFPSVPSSPVEPHRGHRGTSWRSRRRIRRRSRNRWSCCRGCGWRCSSWRSPIGSSRINMYPIKNGDVL